MSKIADAARGLEALLLQRLLESSGAFRGAAGGAELYLDTFSRALAEAGGAGLAEVLEASLAGPSRRPGAARLGADLLAGVPDRVTSDFGRRADPFTGEDAFHTGVDLAAAEGTPILAPRAGTVVRVTETESYGRLVELDHGDGLVTRYAHASEILVREGERVSSGQPIARVGSTGRATGPHLHLEARRDGRAVDPGRALKSYEVRVEDLDAGSAP